jgi:hypothetical protein
MTRTAPRRHLAVEPLERRDTPAGVVDITFADGSVTLIGDAESNNVTIWSNPLPQVVIESMDSTEFHLNGVLMPAPVVLPGEITGGITIRMGDGNDTLALGDLYVPGSMRIFGGAGDETITVDGQLRVDHDLSVTNGPGTHQMQIRGWVEVRGNMSINNQVGHSLLAGVWGSRIEAGSLSVTNGDGYDRMVLFSEVEVRGNFTIRNGPGGSLLDDDVATTITVDGTWSIVSGAGDDTIALESATSIRAVNIAIRPGPGASTATLTPSSDLRVDRNLVVAGGSDWDLVQIGSPFGVAEVGGNVLVNVGGNAKKANYRSTVEVLGSTLTVTGGITVRAGDGQDTVRIQSGRPGSVGGGVAVLLGPGDLHGVMIQGITIAGSLRVGTANNGPGSRTDSVDLLGITVGLQTVITTGAGDDWLQVGGCSFGGPVLMSTGAGDDSIKIESGTNSGVTRFTGTVTVATGAGDDTVAVGRFDPVTGSTGSADFAAANYWIGGPGAADRITIESVNTFDGPQPVLTGFEP